MAKIVSDFSGDTPDAMATTMDLERFSDDDKEQVVFYGINSCLNEPLKESFKDYKSKILVDLWSPCQFNALVQPGNINAHQMAEYFDEVHSICPYTVRWMNKVNDYNKMRYLKSPFNRDLVPEERDKEFDVCYTGSVHSQEFLDLVNTISNFNYRFISKGGTHADISCGKVTDCRITTREKLDMVARCKIGVAINLLYLTPDHVNHFLSYPGIEDNEIYDGLVEGVKNNDTWVRAPQFKIRIHEYAVAKTLILCMRDRWNTIEDYYVPEEDFIYFEDMEDLKNNILAISTNWDKYKPVVESAYDKVSNYYMTDKVIQDITGGGFK